MSVRVNMQVLSEFFRETMTHSWRLLSSCIVLIVILPFWYLTHAPKSNPEKHKTLEQCTWRHSTSFELCTLSTSATRPPCIDHFSRSSTLKLVPCTWSPRPLHLENCTLSSAPIGQHQKSFYTSVQCAVYTQSSARQGAQFASQGFASCQEAAAATIVLNGKDVFNAEVYTPWSLNLG